MTYYEIEFEGNTICVENTLDEPINILYDRWYYIMKYIKAHPDTNDTILNNLSHIYINCKHHNCRYPSYLYQKIDKYL